MMRVATIALFALCLVACSVKEPGRLKTEQDPVTGEPVLMRDVQLGSVRVVGHEGDLAEGFVVWADGQQMFMRFRTDRGSQAAIGGNAPVVEANFDKAGKVTEVRWWGSKYFSIDSNVDGQADLRFDIATKKTEIWIDGQWKVRTAVGEGRDRKYHVGDRQVLLTKDGWQ